MERYICIHGHFYQPPRENAWLEYVEQQNSAYPYHDWNERITAECYLPNASSRILDKEGFIDRMVNNYARMSFNFGSTLLDWMEKNNPEVYQSIIDADRQSREIFSGHGSAMAQAYNHIIMPLANHRDRYSQVVWGIRDFEYRFGRKPEGMWLPETAVDLETLDIMAEAGIVFTVLAPHQAFRVRQAGSQSWKNVPDTSIDPTMAYSVNLPSKRKINVFFYDGLLSHAVAFQDILKNGDVFVKTLMGAFSDKRKQPQLVHIATDGETYGHHHRFGDMALAYTLHNIEADKLAKITNYGEFLKKYPPIHEVEIMEKTSWSCVHGVDRWWSACGDTAGAGGHPTWNQEWRTPLRNAFDLLRDTLAPKYEAEAGLYFKDAWAARNGYIDVILDRSPESRDRFFTEYSTHELTDVEKITALKLLELQRHAMLMYTSCGWFFDEISRPESIQVIQYAGRVAQLADELFGNGIEKEFLEILEKAKSNIPEQGNGRRIYERLVRPAMMEKSASDNDDVQRKALGDNLEFTISSLEKSFLPVLKQVYSPERLSAELGGPVPPIFRAAAGMIINTALHRAVKSNVMDAEKIRDMMETAGEWKIELDTGGIGYDFKITLEKMMMALAANPHDSKTLKDLLTAVSLARSFPFPVDLWKIQNIFWELKNTRYPEFKLEAAKGDQPAKTWVEDFTILGKTLSIKVT
jgi:alpha-amylase/alpha-mannosidase (GH57 family)